MSKSKIIELINKLDQKAATLNLTKTEVIAHCSQPGLSPSDQKIMHHVSSLIMGIIDGRAQDLQEMKRDLLQLLGD